MASVLLDRGRKLLKEVYDAQLQVRHTNETVAVRNCRKLQNNFKIFKTIDKLCNKIEFTYFINIIFANVCIHILNVSLLFR